MAAAKNREIALVDVVLVAGTQQNLTNICFFRYLWMNLFLKTLGKLARLAFKHGHVGIWEPALRSALQTDEQK